MGIFDRLGSIISSYLNDFGDQTSRQYGSSNTSSDPDVNAAFEELNDFLNNKEPRKTDNASNNSSAQSRYSSAHDPNIPPEELRADFEKLEVPFGADEETCKAAFKRLLKIHHPDRHAGHEGNFKKATERMARINASYDRIEKWRQSIGKK
ncbi:MAG: J domain-containing protein [Treponema sp.]|nr:J domain-containing protein [Treponema sp.]MCL2251892.1 J domain-containing protein [Treponema sp.]